jgi:hypothetical protein
MSTFLNASMDEVPAWTLPTHYGCPPLLKTAWSLRVVPVSFPSPFLLLRSAPVACFVLLSWVPIGGC